MRCGSCSATRGPWSSGCTSAMPTPTWPPRSPGPSSIPPRWRGRSSRRSRRATRRSSPTRSAARSRRRLTVWSQAVAVLATAVMYVALAVAAVLILHIALVVLDANGANPIVTTVRRLADKLVGPFAQLFTPQDAKQQVAINYGLAAAVYLAAGGAVSRGIRLLGG